MKADFGDISVLGLDKGVRPAVGPDPSTGKGSSQLGGFLGPSHT